MTKSLKSIVFFGNERLSSTKNYNETPIMQTLLSQNYNIEALIIKNKETKSRVNHHPAVLDLAEKHSINVVKINTSKDLEEAVAGLDSRLAVLSSFGLLLREKVLRHFSLGIINTHPSLLPIGRGSTPIENAILKGDRETGISLIKISQELDAGDIYAQEKLSVKTDESKLSLTKRLGVLASQMLAENLPLILKQQLEPSPQDHAKATYTSAIEARGVLDFQQYPAGYLQRHIRAFEDCPNNKFELNRQIVEIKSAKATQLSDQKEPFSYDKQKKLIYIRCGFDYLAVAQLQPANRNTMSACDFVNGFYRELL